MMRLASGVAENRATAPTKFDAVDPSFRKAVIIGTIAAMFWTGNRLMRGQSGVVAAILVQLAAPSLAVAAAPVLAPGSYAVQVLTDPTSSVVKFDCFYGYLPAGGGGSIGPTTVLSYPGAGKTGATLNTAVEYNGALGPTESIAGVFAVSYALPAVPAAGPGSWAGTYTGVYHGMTSKNGTKLPATNGTATGAATLKLTPISATAFTGTISFVPSGSTAACLLWVSGVLS
jgi:hypothetical protein